MRHLKSRSFEKTLRGLLVRQTSVRIAFVTVLLIAVHAAWTFNERSDTIRRSSDALAGIIGGSIRARDLINLKRSLDAFKAANKDLEVCVKLADGIQLTESQCDPSDFREYVIPLSSERFLIASHWNAWSRISAFGLLFVILAGTVLVQLAHGLRKFSDDAISDLEALKSGISTDRIYFEEFGEAAKSRFRSEELARENARISAEIYFKSQLNELATKVAHDIRSPISAINMIAGNHSGLNEADNKILKAALKRINAIAEELLSQNRKVSVERQVEVLHEADFEIVRSIEDLVGVKAAEHGLSQEQLRFIRFLRSKIFVEQRFQNELLSVISNLVNNAYEASAERITDIEIRLSEDQRFLYLAVTDKGVGVGEDILKSIEMVETASSKQNGNGIGLKTARALAIALGGEMKIQSQINVGTNVILTFSKALICPSEEQASSRSSLEVVSS